MAPNCRKGTGAGRYDAAKRRARRSAVAPPGTIVSRNRQSPRTALRATRFYPDDQRKGRMKWPPIGRVFRRTDDHSGSGPRPCAAPQRPTGSARTEQGEDECPIRFIRPIQISSPFSQNCRLRRKHPRFRSLQCPNRLKSRLTWVRRDALARRLEQARADGDLPSSADPQMLARFLFTIYAGLAVQAADGASKAELRACGELALYAWPAGGSGGGQVSRIPGSLRASVRDQA